MPKIKTSEPWTLRRERKVSGNIEQHGVKGRKNAGGGDNPTRSTLNRNKSGDHMKVDIGPDRSMSGSDKEAYIGPMRGTTGTHKTPHIKTMKQKTKSFYDKK